MRSTAARLGILLFLCASAGAPARAQADLTLRPDTRMRAWMVLPDTTVWTGGLVTLDERYLVLRVNSANPIVRLDLTTVELLEVSRGRDPLLTVGLPVAGAVLGAVLAPPLDDQPLRCREDLVDDPACRSETPVPVIGAAVGGVIGGIVGSLVAWERWLEIPLGSAAGMSVSLRVGLRD